MTQVGDVRTQLLPPGVSATDFARALEEFRAVLGSERVLTSEAELREFRDPFSFSTWDDYTRLGGGHAGDGRGDPGRSCGWRTSIGIPLWTHSAGMNNGYGGPAPRVKGSVILSLRKMNQVLEINEESAYAVVEPGVRWFDLYDAVQAGGHKLMVSIPDLGWGSVIGNYLENGATYLPYGTDMSASVRHGGRAARTGSCMRTGMGAMPGNRSWHVYKRGLGPTPDQLFMQSNFGIVTKMGVLADAGAGVLHAALASGLERGRSRAASSRRFDG